MDPQGLYASVYHQRRRDKDFLDPQFFGDRKYVDNGDSYTSRNSVWLGEEVFFVVSTLIGNPDLGRLRRKPSLNYKKV